MHSIIPIALERWAYNQNRAGIGHIMDVINRTVPADPSFNRSTFTDFLTIPSETKFGDLYFAANFTLVATDGSGEVINIKDASATIPEGTIEYKSGYDCTIIFKICHVTTPYNPDANYNFDAKEIFQLRADAIVYESIDGTSIVQIIQ